MNKNKRYHNRKRNPYPNGIQRLDDSLMSEIRLFVSLGNTIEYTAKRYKVSIQMVKYSCRMGKSFDSLQDDYYKESE